MGCTQSTAKETTSTDNVSKVDDTATTFKTDAMPVVEEEEATVDEIKAVEGSKMQENIEEEPLIEESISETVEDVEEPKTEDFFSNDETEADTSIEENSMNDKLNEEEESLVEEREPELT